MKLRMWPPLGRTRRSFKADVNEAKLGDANGAPHMLQDFMPPRKSRRMLVLRGDHQTNHRSSHLTSLMSILRTETLVRHRREFEGT